MLSHSDDFDQYRRTLLQLLSTKVRLLFRGGIYSYVIFLVACTRLYEPICRSVGLSVSLSVGPSLNACSTRLMAIGLVLIEVTQRQSTCIFSNFDFRFLNVLAYLKKTWKAIPRDHLLCNATLRNKPPGPFTHFCALRKKKLIPFTATFSKSMPITKKR